MARTRKIVSGFRTIGRLTRFNKRLSLRTGTGAPNAVTAAELAQIHALTHGVKGSPPLNLRLINRATRDPYRSCMLGRAFAPRPE